MIDDIQSVKECSGDPECQDVCETMLINKTLSNIEAEVIFSRDAMCQAMISCQQSTSDLASSCNLKCMKFIIIIVCFYNYFILIAVADEIMEDLPPPTVYISAIDSSTVKLSWNFSSSTDNCADHFEIYLFINGKQQNKTFLTNSTNYNVTNVSLNTIYSFRVSSINTIRNETGLRSEAAMINLVCK